ncbi:hypothetical protein KIW84_060677 [Lathyrus oleraceus]|uniref:Uncharacterized protein n=1 Tax=Pisum sativum TaxID=3888 RepID=A0A9D4W3D4_PEA|nr:hypothetical protein KIW84_060677 [Pisum sativum]
MDGPESSNTLSVRNRDWATLWAITCFRLCKAMLLYKNIFGNVQPRHLVEWIPVDDDWVTLNVDGANTKGKHTSLNDACDKKARAYITCFFYRNEIDFNVSKSFKLMVEAIGKAVAPPPSSSRSKPKAKKMVVVDDKFGDQEYIGGDGEDASDRESDDKDLDFNDS